MRKGRLAAQKAQRTWRAARERSWAQAGHPEAQAEVKGRGTCQGRAQWAGGGGGKKLAGRRKDKRKLAGTLEARHRGLPP